MPSPLERLSDERLRARGVTVWLKRDDLLHPTVPGNKHRKLALNLVEAKRQEARTLLTFGGAYSNHIRAVAAAGRLTGLATVGIIRGEEHRPLNPSLDYAARQGMRLAYMDRTTYRRKADPDILAALRDRFGPHLYVLPEGGTNEPAVRGCAALPGEVDEPFDVICCACGTGGTLAGIAGGLPPGRRALGFAALRGVRYLEAEVAALQEATFGERRDNWSIEHDYHFGGFARRTPELDAFVADFERRHGLRLEWVYVAKMMFGLFDLVERGRFAAGSSVVAVVTGPPGPEDVWRPGRGQGESLGSATRKEPTWGSGTS